MRKLTNCAEHNLYMHSEPKIIRGQWSISTQATLRANHMTGHFVSLSAILSQCSPGSALYHYTNTYSIAHYTSKPFKMGIYMYIIIIARRYRKLLSRHLIQGMVSCCLDRIANLVL